jgi:hypothetical protein
MPKLRISHDQFKGLLIAFLLHEYGGKVDSVVFSCISCSLRQTVFVSNLTCLFLGTDLCLYLDSMN